MFHVNFTRLYDAGTITAGHITAWTITVPPNSEDHVVVGHCSPSCSSNIPETGINVFNILLHSHLAGDFSFTILVQFHRNFGIDFYES